jgi:outer membrane protein assembly factor BamB
MKWFLGLIDQNKDNTIDSTEWKAAVGQIIPWPGEDHGLLAIKPGGKGDVTITHILWQEKTSIPEVPSPLYYKGRVYIVKDGGIVTCMDAKNGKRLYRERLGASGSYYSSPIAAQDRIYIASGKGDLVVFTAGDQFKVLARNNLGEPIMATPAIVDHKLYVRTAENLYAFGE